jgi:hypothetical protein
MSSHASHRRINYQSCHVHGRPACAPCSRALRELCPLVVLFTHGTCSDVESLALHSMLYYCILRATEVPSKARSAEGCSGCAQAQIGVAMLVRIVS